MRTFSCFAYGPVDSQPTSATILAADEWRARVLARRELLAVLDAGRVEIWEGRRLVSVETRAAA